MLPEVFQELEAAKKEVVAILYQCDQTQCFEILRRLLGQKVKVRFLLDRDNFYRSSCVKQAQEVESLWRSNGEIRVQKPVGSGFAVVHTKTIIIESCTLT